MPVKYNCLKKNFSDPEVTLEKCQLGGVKVGVKKVSTLSYADNIVLLARAQEKWRKWQKICHIYRKE